MATRLGSRRSPFNHARLLASSGCSLRGTAVLLEALSTHSPRGHGRRLPEEGWMAPTQGSESLRGLPPALPYASSILYNPLTCLFSPLECKLYWDRNFCQLRSLL